MISVVHRRLSQALFAWPSVPVDSQNGNHELTSPKYNMVASSRSLRGRVSLRSDQDAEQQQAAGEQQNVHVLRHDHDHQEETEATQELHLISPHGRSDVQKHSPETAITNPPVSPSQTQSSSTRSKRSRIASVSDRESLQKRRRTSKEAEALPALAIPLRGRAGTLPGKQGSAARTAPNVTAGGTSNNRPQLAQHDSQASFSSAQSPLQSPYQRPQYDQFRRIEEKAQRTAKKRISNGTAQEDKRKLRSEHGSTRSKTELAQYFPNFDEMMSLQRIDPYTLTQKTPILLVDDTPSFQPGTPHEDYFRSNRPPHGSVTVDLSQYAASQAQPVMSRASEDPLADYVYLKAHQKAERHEKQIKNGDKERAQHEKYQLERLLDELRGPDWLKTLGVSGITDTEKKRYESKRILFIRETRALINKFKRWKDEEKRHKLEKQQQLQEEAEADAETDEQSSKAGTPALRRAQKAVHKAGQRSLLTVKNQSRTSSRAASTRSADPAHDSHDIDALASQQLLKEAKMASVHRKRPSSHNLLAALPPAEETVRRPFVSFFDKRHIRDAAVENRLRGRKSYAFGQEVLELPEKDFELPDDLLTEDLIRSNQRNRRRRMRGTDD